MRILEGRDLKDFRVLDLGCAHFGKDLNLMRMLGTSKCIGLDREVLVRSQLPVGIEAIRADLCCHNLPIVDDSFDLIILDDVIEHLDDPLHVLKESRRVLRNGGLLAIITPNQANLKNRIRLLLGKSVHDPLDYWLVTGRKESGGRTYFMGHIREYTVQEVKSMSSMAGFGVYSVNLFPANERPPHLPGISKWGDPIDILSHSRFLFFIYGLMERLFPNLAYRISLIAVK